MGGLIKKLSQVLNMPLSVGNGGEVRGKMHSSIDLGYGLKLKLTPSVIEGREREHQAAVLVELHGELYAYAVATAEETHLFLLDLRKQSDQGLNNLDHGATPLAGIKRCLESGLVGHFQHTGSVWTPVE